MSQQLDLLEVTDETRDRTRIGHGAELHLDTADHLTVEMALAFWGIGTLPAAALSENASWDRTGAASTVGRAEILAHLPQQPRPASVTVSQVVSNGKASTVSGRLTRDGTGVALFCLVLRFTTPARTEIAQVVSFEQAELT